MRTLFCAVLFLNLASAYANPHGVDPALKERYVSLDRQYQTAILEQQLLVEEKATQSKLILAAQKVNELGYARALAKEQLDEAMRTASGVCSSPIMDEHGKPTYFSPEEHRLREGCMSKKEALRLVKKGCDAIYEAKGLPQLATTIQGDESIAYRVEKDIELYNQGVNASSVVGVPLPCKKLSDREIREINDKGLDATILTTYTKLWSNKEVDGRPLRDRPYQEMLWANTTAQIKALGQVGPPVPSNADRGPADARTLR